MRTSEDGPVIHRFKPFCTSKVWRFPDPDTGFLNIASNRPDLIRSIVSYRANNRLPPIENLDLVLENYLAGLPENVGETEPIRLKRGFLMTLKGGVALLEWALFPKALTVSQDIADRRAAQCADCKFNEFPDKGLFVEWCDGIALACTDGLKATNHDKLGNCMMCGCVLRAKVFYGGDPKLTEEQKDAARQVNCWQLEFYDKAK